MNDISIPFGFFRIRTKKAASSSVTFANANRANSGLEKTPMRANRTLRKVERNRPKTGLLKLLTDLRIEQNIPQRVLAEMIGVHYNALSRWETGARMPNLSLAIAWANSLGAEIVLDLEQVRKKK